MFDKHILLNISQITFYLFGFIVNGGYLCTHIDNRYYYGYKKTTDEGDVCAAPNKTPRSVDIEGIIKDAIVLRTKMQSVLWDTTFDNQFADEIDAMQTEVNCIIANCAPLLGWARAGELGDYIIPAIAPKTKH